MSGEDLRKELERRTSFLAERLEMVKTNLLSSLRESVTSEDNKSLPIHMRANAMLDDHSEKH